MRVACCLHLTAGGTVSTGGIGQSSFLHGSQADNVLALDVMTTTGAVLHCTPVENTDLFNAVRAGLGQVAIIVNVYMQLIPVPERVTVYKLIYINLKEFIDAQLHLMTQSIIRVDAIQSHVTYREKDEIETRLMQPLTVAQLAAIKRV